MWLHKMNFNNKLVEIFNWCDYILNMTIAGVTIEKVDYIEFRLSFI